MPTIADLADELTLLELAGGPTYLEGATCAEHHCVTLLESGPELVRAEAQDTVTYLTTLTLADGKLAWECTCGHATATAPFHHFVAVGVTLWRESPPRADHPEDAERGRGVGLPKEQD
jgi:uncharacterized Zn finger protein